MDGETPGEAIGANVRALRTANLYTRKELSGLTGLSEIAIINLEQGRTGQPRRATVEKLAEALGVPIERLLEGTAGHPKASAQLSSAEMLRVRPEDIATREAVAEVEGLNQRRDSGEISPEEYQILVGELLRKYSRRQDQARGEAG